jgi:hydroxypyruvate reductase
MLRAACDAPRVRIVEALVTGRPAPDVALDAPVAFVDGSHPLPDAKSAIAGRRALDIAANACVADELLLVLLSGGASSMLAAPADGVSLDDKRHTIDAMMRAGADIAQLNCVRRHLSSIKGGRLAAAAGRVLTLALSDVHWPEDDPATIGSGPTAADPTTFADALVILDELACEVPAAIRTHLRRGAAGEREETVKPGDPGLSRAAYRVVGNRRMAMDGAAREAARRGYAPRILTTATHGEARDAGRSFVDAVLAQQSHERPLCAIASGETTVRVGGDGVGGRNQEFVLGALRSLEREAALAVVASIGTDGVDGPTDAAGAFVSSETLARFRAEGIDPDDALVRNDAYPALARVDALIRFGPTGTNVGDVHIVLKLGR